MIGRIISRSVVWCAGLCTFLFFMEAYIRLAFPNATTIIPPSVAIASIPDLFIHHDFAMHIWWTIQRILIVFGAAVFLSSIITILLRYSRSIRYLVMPVIDLLRPLPSVAIIPVFIMICGFSSITIVAAATIGTTWPISLAMYQAILRQDQSLAISIRQLQIAWLSRMWRLELPAAFPRIVSGLQIGVSIAVILVITAEMFISSRGGVGSLIPDLALGGKSAEATGCIIVLAFLGLGLNQTVSLLCSAIPWSRNQYEVARD